MINVFSPRVLGVLTYAADTWTLMRRDMGRSRPKALAMNAVEEI